MNKTKNTAIKTSETERNYVNILGIKVLSSSASSLLVGVGDFISRSNKFYIVTPNPELILASLSDKELKESLNSADFSIPDGVGVVMAGRFLGLPVPENKLSKIFVTFFQGLKVGLSVFFDKKWLINDFENIKGREFFLDLAKLAARKNWKIFLLGGLDNEAELAAHKLKNRYRNLKIESDKGPTLDKNAEPISEKDKKVEKQVINKINKFNPQLLFVAFGNPKQEIWIKKNLSRLNIGGAMAVGGTFRYIAGHSKLPPKWMAGIGLEWLYRLITEPMRFRRIFNAFPTFPLKIWMNRLR